MSDAAITAPAERAMAPAGTPARVGLGLRYDTLLRWVCAAFVFSGCIAVIEPSPYDFWSMLFAPMLLVSGIKLYRSHLFILFLWLIYLIGGFLALLPHWGQPDPTLFQFQSLYLVVTFCMFLVFFSQDTLSRVELAAKAFTAGCLMSSLIGIAGFLDVAGLRETITVYEGRVTGLFKDPNVFGSYMILGALYPLQLLLLGRTRRPWTTFAVFVIIVTGIFLSFSRGSIAATGFACIMVFIAGYLTCGSAQIRLRFLFAALAGAVFIAAATAFALSIETVRDLIEIRFSAVQDYDAGYYGRWSNQLRSLPMLLELPNGFGPLRFRLTFNLDPHSSYINAFASYGWIGGFSWFLIVGFTCWIGFRLMFTPSPFRYAAQIWFATLFVLLLQGFQIDIDHWRWVFLSFATVWALETARLKWLAEQDQPGDNSANPG